MKKIEINSLDLSLPSLSEVIQKNESVASDLVSEIANGLEEIKSQINEYETHLESLRWRKKELTIGCINIAKHLEKTLPLAVSREKSIIIISESDVKIERNVI
jgi:DNA-binding protein H-NS